MPKIIKPYLKLKVIEKYPIDTQICIQEYLDKGYTVEIISQFSSVAGASPSYLVTTFTVERIKL